MLVFRRLYSSVAKAKGQLAALRKKTGFPIGKCKEALQENANDLEAAEVWLHKQAQAEGWTKVETLQNRAANQGLVGLLVRGNKGAMVEVNCETDFVAKNEHFQLLVSKVTDGLFAHQTTRLDNFTFVTAEELGKLETTDGTSLGDAVASTVGRLGEKLVLQRGCLLSASEDTVLCGQVYNNLSPGRDVALGKYAALLHLAPTQGPFVDREAVEKLGRDLGQHIIGMNPAAANPEDEGYSSLTQVLTNQDFVLDSTMNVGHMLEERGAKVTQFVRYAVGENQKSDGLYYKSVLV